MDNRGTFKYRSNGPLVATSWVDKKTIYFLSTRHAEKCSFDVYVKRRTSDGSLVDLKCPPCLPDYTAFMRGVDRADQMQSYYNVGRRSKKWWRRVFFYIVECCILNSFVMDLDLRPAEHARLGRAKRDMLKFRLELGHLLIGDFTSRVRLGRPRSDEHAQLTRLQHSHRHWPVLSSRKNNCVVCAGKVVRQRLPSRGNQHETKFMCQECDVHLCIFSGRNCFEIYHTRTDYCH